MLYFWGKKCKEFGSSSLCSARKYFLNLKSMISVHRYNTAEGVRCVPCHIVRGAQTQSLNREDRGIYRRKMEK